MKVLKDRILSVFPYVVFFIVGIFLLFKPVLDGDEIWNYNFARNICEGRFPYVDFNMVPTPLSAYLVAGVLKIFGNTLFYFRIVAIILLKLVFGSLYRLCEKIIGDKTTAFVITVFVYGLNFIFWNYNYNNLNLLLIIWILCLEWRKEKNKEKSGVICDVLIGILVGIVPVIKQSTGAVLLFINVVLCIGDIIIERRRWKQKVVRVGISVIPTAFLAGTLIIQNSFDDFYDYAIAGIGEFMHQISYFEFLLSTPITFLIGIFPIVTILLCIRTMLKNRAMRKSVGTMLLWAIGGAVVAYPLCDSIHMVVAIVPFVPCIFLCCKIKKLRRYEKCICYVVAFVVLSVLAIGVFPKTGEYKKCELNGFEGIPMEIALEDHIIEVTEYIKEQEQLGNKAVVADEYGVLYSIVLNQCNKDFDLLNQGNLGTKTDFEILAAYEDYIILVRRDESNMGYQADRELISVVKNNYEKIDEVGSFDAYIRKEKD